MDIDAEYKKAQEISRAYMQPLKDLIGGSMTDTKKKAEFKPINVAKDDWEEYNQAAMSLSVERGKRVSIPALLKESYSYYINSGNV